MSTAIDFRQLLPVINEAGEIILSAHKMESGDSDDISVKAGSANFVTVYDVNVQSFLISRITELIPDAVFIAEEKENDPSVLEQAHCFIIDPIDGTTNFIHDYRHSCISVAMISHGEVVLGIIYDPYLGDLYYAEKGKGAFLNGKPMQVSSTPFSSSLIAYGTAGYYKDKLGNATFEMSKEIFMTARDGDVRRCGSAALDLAYLAAGRNDLFFELMLSPWDIAAASLLITEAGGIISDMDGNPIDLSRPSPILAGNPVAYPQLLEIAKKYRV